MEADFGQDHDDSGKRLYSPEVVSRFDEIRKKLREDNVEKFIQIGKTFKVA